MIVYVSMVIATAIYVTGNMCKGDMYCFDSLYKTKKEWRDRNRKNFGLWFCLLYVSLTGPFGIFIYHCSYGPAGFGWTNPFNNITKD